MPAKSEALVEHANSFWIVERVDSMAKTLFLSCGQPGELIEVAEDDPGIRVVAYPRLSWPFEVSPTRVSFGPVREILRTNRTGGAVLRRLQDWVPSNFQRSGGPIFFNPSLRLRTGEVLVLQDSKGRLSRMTITPTFGSLAKREARREKGKPQPVTVYDRILKGPFDDE